jgi:hypothetical protein
MALNSYRIPLVHRPRRLAEGDAVVLPRRLVEKDDEIALGTRLLCHRRLFGACYQGLLTDYFETMNKGSGVMVGAFIPSTDILPDLRFPGDIDLLVIPYAGDELVISETLVVELKAVRASFAKQGKSPNEFGFSQATALFSTGFPYAAVGHLITSDDSPEDSWRRVLVARIIDPEAGTVEDPQEVSADMLPSDLIARCFGRMKANCNNASLGFFAAYVSDGGWFPQASAARKNPIVSPQVCEAIGRYYEANYAKFMDIPKF